MKGLARAIGNALNAYKSTVHIKQRDVLAAYRAAAKRSRIEDSIVELEINTNSDAQDEAYRQNAFRLVSIQVKEGIA